MRSKLYSEVHGYTRIHERVCNRKTAELYRLVPDGNALLFYIENRKKNSRRFVFDTLLFVFDSLHHRHITPHSLRSGNTHSKEYIFLFSCVVYIIEREKCQ